MSSRAFGSLLALGAATLWGVSGNFAQFLFQHRGVDSTWMVTLRMLVAGFILLVIGRLRGLDIFAVWRSLSTYWDGMVVFNGLRSDGLPERAGWKAAEIFAAWLRFYRSDACRLVLFAVIGMLGVQYTYFAAIRTSNAATATVLQYLGPVFIAIWSAWTDRRVPRAVEVAAVVLAVAGTVLLVTHGDLGALAISVEALVWGLLSALTLAFYSIQPIPLLRRYDASVVVGWGMLVGGLALSFFHPPWRVSGVWDFAAFGSAAFIVLLGSLAAFYGYLSAVALIGAHTASLLACAEPLSAMIVAVIWLHVPLTWPDWLGTAFILATIALLTWRESRDAAI